MQRLIYILLIVFCYQTLRSSRLSSISVRPELHPAKLKILDLMTMLMYMLMLLMVMMMPMLRLMEMPFVEDAFFSNCNQADAGSQSMQLLTTLKLKLQCFKDLLFSLNLNSQA